MDAALAGLIGALGGSALGAAGAWGAARIAFRGARYQADTQAKSNHDQWLRQIRRDVYAAFISQAREFLDGPLDRAQRRENRISTMPIHQFEELFRDCNEGAQGLARTAEGLKLEAPPDLVRLVGDFVSSAGAISTCLAVTRGRPPELDPGTSVHGRCRELQHQLQTIHDLCRASLQEG
ncbi:hypothetical protein GCM10009646_72810 [Streptomyces aureus]